MKNDSTLLNRANIEHLRGSAGTAHDTPAVAKSAAGFGDPIINRRSCAQPIAGAFFVPAVRRYGGLCGETFGSAGVLLSRFANPGASARPQIPPQQIATALIDSQLIAYQINRRPHQLAYLLELMFTIGAMDSPRGDMMSLDMANLATAAHLLLSDASAPMVAARRISQQGGGHD